MFPVVEVRNVVKRYNRQTAVDHVSFTVMPGRIFALLGPNGAGKTSIIRLMLGILFPDGGEIHLFGRRPSEARERVGYLPEARGLYLDDRLDELLVYLGTLKGLRPSVARQRAQAWLSRLGLREKARHRVRELSHGMLQRAQIIAALIHDPPLVVLDEPFQGLDPPNIEAIKTLITELRSQGKTIIISSHQLVHVEALADEVALIHRGRIVAQGTLENLRRSFARGDIAIRLKDGAPLPEGLPIQYAHEQNGTWRVIPQPGIAPKEVLHRLLDMNLEVERFEILYPSLEEIFFLALESTHQEGGLWP